MPVLELGTWNLGKEDCPQILESVKQSKSAYKLYKLAKKNNVILQIEDNIGSNGAFFPGTLKVVLNSSLKYPAPTFAHEMVHYLQYTSNPKQFDIDIYNPDRSYANLIYVEIAAYKMSIRVVREMGLEPIYENLTDLLYSPSTSDDRYTILATAKRAIRDEIDYRWRCIRGEA